MLSSLSEYVFTSKYPKYLPALERRETYIEAVNRVMDMHQAKYPQLDLQELAQAYAAKRIAGSQRGLQFGGDAITEKNARIYNCFHESTTFVTSEGVKSFSDFKEGDQVIVQTHTGAWKPATVHSYGTQNMNKITVKRGAGASCEIIATPDHRWILSDGETTTQLKEKDLLLPSIHSGDDFDYDSATPLERLYWCYGYVYGDGTKVKYKGEYAYSMVRLCNKDRHFAQRFIEMGFKTSQSLSLNGDFMAYTGSYLKTAPDPSVDSPEQIRAFVMGYLSADGTKNSSFNGNNSRYNYIQATGASHCEFIRTCFPIAGVYILSEADLTGQVTNYTAETGRPYTIKFRICSKFTNTTTKWNVKSIEPYGAYTAWCLSVEDDQSFILSQGIATGNCVVSYCDRPEFFMQCFWLLLCGCGAGFSVQKHHVDKLPQPSLPVGSHTHIVEDSIEGWAIAANALLDSYFTGGSYPLFDFSKVRPKGAALRHGGLAPGPDPLQKALLAIRSILSSVTKQERKLKPIEAFDITMHLADAVISGGIRRSATIAIFSPDDTEMMTSKTGNWFVDNPQRGRANISAMLLPSTPRPVFSELFTSTKEFGEPGFIFSESTEYLYNPCVEIGMCPTLIQYKGETLELYTPDLLDPTKRVRYEQAGYSFQSGWQACNLTTINCSAISSEEEFMDAVTHAATLGTIQASYTDFPFLGAVTEQIVRRESLLGVSMTGILSDPMFHNADLLEKAKHRATLTNKLVSEQIGIPRASRITCVKPEGTASIVLGTSAGIHPYHAKKYIRRVQADMLEPLYQAVLKSHPSACDKSVWGADSQRVIAFPCEAPANALTKTDLSALKHLELCKTVNRAWVYQDPATLLNRCAGLQHNVSITVSVAPDEWVSVEDYIWENREYFTGISLLSTSGDYDYQQPPYAEVFDDPDPSDPHYDEKIKVRDLFYALSALPEIDLNITEDKDTTDAMGEIACGPNGCDLQYDMD